MDERFDLGQQMASDLFAPQALLSIAAAVAFFALMGYASLRYLRREDDFPHKEQMLWGAQWMWAVFGALFNGCLLSVYLGITLSPYCLTFMVLGGAFVHAGFWAISHLLPWQCSGAYFAAVRFGFWSRGKPFDVHEWLSHGERQCRKWRPLTLGMTVLTLVGCGLLVWRFTYPVDRAMLAYRQMAEFAAALERELADPDVQEVTAASPEAEQWMNRVRWRKDTRAPASAEHMLFVALRSDAEPDRPKEVFDRVQLALRKLGREERWRISVYRRRQNGAVRGYYDPSRPQKSATLRLGRDAQ